MKIELLLMMPLARLEIQSILTGIIKIIKLFYRTRQVSKREFKIEIRFRKNVFNLL
jgi:hypothetical protein